MLDAFFAESKFDISHYYGKCVSRIICISQLSAGLVSFGFSNTIIVLGPYRSNIKTEFRPRVSVFASSLDS